LDNVQESGIIISSQGNNASDKQEIHIMTKKIVTVEAPKPVKTELTIAEAIALDANAAKKSDASGITVAGAFDRRFDFDWGLFKGNQSADTCGMSQEDFNAVKQARTEYRDLWKKKELKNFDRRWQFVNEHSTHAALRGMTTDIAQAEEEAEAEQTARDTARGKYDQCIKALENALRYATDAEFDGDLKTAPAIREALKLNGIVEAA
tara:strand:+ start:3518 stop:4138 length:621 start_codon:yes stop_codon:yes gene_type:complete